MKITVSFCVLMIAACLVASSNADDAPNSSEQVHFEQQIAPLFEEHCIRCHSPNNRKGELSLETIADLKEKSYVTPGDPDGSYLIDVVTPQSGEPAEMPKEGDALSAEEVGLLKLWIKQGATWPENVLVQEKSKADKSWWSLQPLAEVIVPKPAGLPDSWQANPIDAFVFSQLAEQGLTPNQPADRRTLIRRLTYDLTGLPPTPLEIEAFEKNSDPQAYEQLVDRLLASPRYGERWGRHWLDVVRFGESNGFERNVIINDLWPFRDYVIESINQNKPMDQFIREHLAGDIFGKGKPDQEIGAAFLVAGPYDNVGNQDPVAAAQIRANTIDEMIRTSGESFLGLTLGCARCHDHKFDPILQTDYYRWYATFAGVRHGSRVWATPEEQRRHVEQMKPLNARKAELTQQQRELKKAIAQRLWESNEEWSRPAVDARKNEETFPTISTKYVRFSISLTNQSQPCIDELEIYRPDDSSNLALASAGGQATASSLLPGYPMHQIEHLNDGQSGNSHSWISKDATGWAQIELPRQMEINRVVWGRDREGKYRDRLPLEYRIEVSVDGQSWREVVNGGDRKPVDQSHLTRRGLSGHTLSIEKNWTRPPVDRLGTTEKFNPVQAKFVRLVCEAQDGNPASSSGFRIDEFEVWSAGSEPQNVALANNGGKATGKAREIKDFPNAYGPHLAIDGKGGERFLAAGNDLTIKLSKPTSINRVTFSSARGEATPSQRKFVFVADYRIEVSLDGKSWREVAHGRDRKPASEAHRKHRIAQATQPTSEEAAKLKKINQELAQVSREIKAVPSLQTAWLGSRQSAPGPFYTFLGGSPQKKGAEVVAASLSTLDQAAPTYRLTQGDSEADRRRNLAEWITSPKNPLTARVLVNRVWQNHFGTGIVSTPNDFGYMGSKPTHPLLLDWLAGQLHEHNWRLKPLHKMIVLSQSYRQSSLFREDVARIDGNARYLWRFPPRRLSAEEIRDTILAVSGRLNEKMGGPGFRLYDYQQDNVATYVPLDQHGPETYRRAVYHQNARASVVDLMTEFDQPDCAYSTPERAETTTPLQALTMLNHQFTLDMAEALAERLRSEGGDKPEQQIEHAFALCYGRQPTKAEISDCLALIEEHSLTAFCRVLLNTSELIYVQ
jgi:mono/diheme cytochrome c family protein